MLDCTYLDCLRRMRRDTLPRARLWGVSPVSNRTGLELFEFLFRDFYTMPVGAVRVVHLTSRRTGHVLTLRFTRATAILYARVDGYWVAANFRLPSRSPAPYVPSGCPVGYEGVGHLTDRGLSAGGWIFQISSNWVKQVEGTDQPGKTGIMAWIRERFSGGDMFSWLWLSCGIAFEDPNEARP